MELIALDNNLKEKYFLNVDIDFEVGDSSTQNNFELTKEGFDEYALHIPGTEYGGVLEYENGISDSTEATFRGWTWRGLLTQWIISPPSGSDYKVVSGEANTVMRELLSDVLGGFFIVPETDSGLTVTNYQFDRHCTVLDGLMKMLSQYGYRLKIYSMRNTPGESIQVNCEAVPIEKVEGTYDEDTGLNLQFTNNRMGINHLICLGRGELQERQRIDLFLDENGNITDSQYYTGFLERQAVFDYSNAESLTDLETKGIERLKEIANSKKLQINEVSDVDLEIGDIVVGRKNEMGLAIEKPIIQKILRISGGNESIEYKVKGEG